jgi:hypothetical protein
MWIDGLKPALVAAIGLTIVGCAPAHQAFDRRAAELGFERDVVEGTGFEHALYQSRGTRTNLALHVYIGGDGTPWLRGRWPAADPTPRQDVALELMALDTAPSVYLGRPCYHGFAQVSPCEFALWTDRRFSTEVVLSMVAALRRSVAPSRPIVLIGYSGGGTLAMLMAPMIDAVRGIITIAGNLDPAAWAEHHGYRALQGSLNPPDRGPLPWHIAQLHLAGGADTNVPPELTRRALATIAAPRPEILDQVDHSVGWRQKWLLILCGDAEVSEIDSSNALQCASEVSAEPKGDRRAIPITMP